MAVFPYTNQSLRNENGCRQNVFLFNNCLLQGSLQITAQKNNTEKQVKDKNQHDHMQT
jgi:hypothetical protein